MSAVLITGGTGLIGSFVVRSLLEIGERPVVFDIAEPGPSLRDISGEFVFIKGTVTDSEGVAHALDTHRISKVIHMAGVLQFGCERDPGRAAEVNVMGLLNIIRAAVQTKIRKMVFASSSATYGTQSGMLQESSPVSSELSLYGATKLLGENLLERYYRVHGLPYIALRYSAVYGPGEVSSPGMADVIKKIEKTILGQDMVIDEVAAEDRRNFTFVKDAAAATINALMAEKNVHRVFNITGGEQNYTSSADFHQIIKKLVPSAGRAIFQGKGRDRGMIDISLARQELGYSPRFSLEEGIREDIAFYSGEQNSGSDLRTREH
jgi:UDP-glucose 4-epimerase